MLCSEVHGFAGNDFLIEQVFATCISQWHMKMSARINCVRLLACPRSEANYLTFHRLCQFKDRHGDVQAKDWEDSPDQARPPLHLPPEIASNALAMSM